MPLTPVCAQNLRWRDSSRFVWTEGLQTLFVFQRLGKGWGGHGNPAGVLLLLGCPWGRRWVPTFTPLFLPPAAAVLYCYFYKRTAVHLGDPLFYQDSLWLRKEFEQLRG